MNKINMTLFYINYRQIYILTQTYDLAHTEEEEEKYCIDQLRTHNGHSNYND